MHHRLLVAFAVTFFAPTLPGLAQDAAAGAQAFRQCQACHAVDQEQNRVGPHLVGIIDRPVASVEGFTYSDGMLAFAEGDKTWDEETMAGFLANPRQTVEGTKMAFAGVRNEEQIANIIEYLKDPAAAQ
jgi:cytochrome c